MTTSSSPEDDDDDDDASSLALSVLPLLFPLGVLFLLLMLSRLSSLVDFALGGGRGDAALDVNSFNVVGGLVGDPVLALVELGLVGDDGRLLIWDDCDCCC